MARVKNQDIPAGDVIYVINPPEDYLLGEAYQQAVTEGVPLAGRPGIDVVRRSPKIGRPSKRGRGTTAQQPVRQCMIECGAIWRALPAAQKACIKWLWQNRTPPPPIHDIPPEGFGGPYQIWLMYCMENCLMGNRGVPGPAPWDECCEGATIGYTTLAMAVNETQQLYVLNGFSWAPYSFQINSGGGSITPSGLYTAPSTNPNCESNVEIGLNCFGLPINSLNISINGYSDLTVSAGFTCERDILPVPPNHEGSCSFCFNCLGEPSLFVDGHCTNSRVTACATTSVYCRGYESLCSDCDFGGDGMTCGGTPRGGVYDFRSAAEKAAGCCPPQLM